MVRNPTGTSSSAKPQGFLTPAELSSTEAPAAGLAPELLSASLSEGSASSSGPTGDAHRILGSSRQRSEPLSPYTRATRWVARPWPPCGCFRAIFSTALPRARLLGPTGARGSGLVRRPPDEQASGGVAGPAGDRREQTNEEGDEPAARLEKNSPKNRREKPGGGDRQFRVVNKVYSKQRGS